MLSHSLVVPESTKGVTQFVDVPILSPHGSRQEEFPESIYQFTMDGHISFIEKVPFTC